MKNIEKFVNKFNTQIAKIIFEMLMFIFAGIAKRRRNRKKKERMQRMKRRGKMGLLFTLRQQRLKETPHLFFSARGAGRIIFRTANALGLDRSSRFSFKPDQAKQLKTKDAYRAEKMALKANLTAKPTPPKPSMPKAILNSLGPQAIKSVLRPQLSAFQGRISSPMAKQSPARLDSNARYYQKQMLALNALKTRQVAPATAFATAP